MSNNKTKKKATIQSDDTESNIKCHRRLRRRHLVHEKFPSLPPPCHYEKSSTSYKLQWQQLQQEQQECAGSKILQLQWYKNKILLGCTETGYLIIWQHPTASSSSPENNSNNNELSKTTTATTTTPIVLSISSLPLTCLSCIPNKDLLALSGSEGLFVIHLSKALSGILSLHYSWKRNSIAKVVIVSRCQSIFGISSNNNNNNNGILYEWKYNDNQKVMKTKQVVRSIQPPWKKQNNNNKNNNKNHYFTLSVIPSQANDNNNDNQQVNTTKVTNDSKGTTLLLLGYASQLYQYKVGTSVRDDEPCNKMLDLSTMMQPPKESSSLSFNNNNDHSDTTEYSISTIACFNPHWWTIGGTTISSSTYTNSLGGFVITIHGPTKSIISKCITRESIQYITFQNNRVLTCGNEGVLSCWESVYALERSHRIWCSPPSIHAIATTTRTTSDEIDDNNSNNNNGSDITQDVWIAVAGVGSMVDVLKVQPECTDPVICWVNALEYTEGNQEEESER